ncbi:tRNA pseudouridine(55) synthase TruB [Gleimia hominis]|uniref:tRNA pseudouridine(55) synthase TruB n=1 Tax=Gleimia hominis TaxID=595468 RepID=UPI0018EDA6BE|nr:tRNA pseudouridine(55) synthase TruB [Gleimia hominis]WIK64924.1 tRNA pseudouridine(55) synthase TruB [Gleimia hominis]
MRQRLDVPRAGQSAADGFVIVDKPKGVTSHDVVAAMRRLCATRKVGHGGTLDPMATGVLVIAVGRATRLLRYVSEHDKAYEAQITLGVSTETDDSEGSALQTPGCAATPDQIDCAIERFTGQIEQVPAAVSAIKVGGQRAYARVRSGEAVQLKARPVTVHEFARTSEVETLELPVDARTVTVEQFDAHVECSSGTYVRALARDVGQVLGCGGHLTRLRRTRVGAWSKPRTIAELVSEVEAAGRVETSGLTAACTALFPQVEVSDSAAQQLSHGNTHGLDLAIQPGARAVATHEGRAVAVVRMEQKLKAELVFA